MNVELPHDLQEHETEPPTCLVGLSPVSDVPAKWSKCTSGLAKQVGRILILGCDFVVLGIRRLPPLKWALDRP